jgi:hypothetical protein
MRIADAPEKGDTRRRALSSHTIESSVEPRDGGALRQVVISRIVTRMPVAVPQILTDWQLTFNNVDGLQLDIPYHPAYYRAMRF